MNILSLFDGMSCGQIAFKQLGITVDRYVSYEIDKYALQVTQHNFPTTEQRGDVFAADFTQYAGIDWLIGGSPCTSFSVAQKNNRETKANNGIGWELFSQYVRALHEAKPHYFLYENVKSMSKEVRSAMVREFGFDATEINSALVSAQNRQRLYWVGKKEPDGSYSKVPIKQPTDRGIVLRDVLDSVTSEKGYLFKPLSDSEMSYMISTAPDGRNHFKFGYYVDGGKDKSPCVLANLRKGVPFNVCCEPLRIGTIQNELKNPAHDSKQYRVYSPDGKSTTLCGQGGGVGAKTGLYATPPSGNFPTYEVRDHQIRVAGQWYPINLADGQYVVRKLTVNECKRLQTIPNWYDISVLSNSQAYKCIGNGWTIEVIMYLINSAMEV